MTRPHEVLLVEGETRKHLHNACLARPHKSGLIAGFPCRHLGEGTVLTESYLKSLCKAWLSRRLLYHGQQLSPLLLLRKQKVADVSETRPVPVLLQEATHLRGSPWDQWREPL